MQRVLGEEEIKQFCDDQFKIVEQYCKIYNISRRKLLSQTWVKAGGEFVETREKHFLEKIRSDPIGLFTIRILFVVYTLPEDFSRRLELYKISDPVEDHRQLCTLILALRGSNCESYFRNLAYDFMVNAGVDSQKLSGRPGTIAELRENYERVTELEDGTQKWEIDLWPRAKVVLFIRIKDKRVEAHFYLLQKQSEYEFNNFVDRFMIGWMQGFDDKELRDDSYEFRRRDPEVLIYKYDVKGKLLEKFPFALKEKYKPLIERKAKEYHFEPWEDMRAKAEEAFFKSILKYLKGKGPPPGYFKLALRHSLSKEYAEKIRKGDIFDRSKRENGETVEGVPKVEIMPEETESDSVLIDRVLSDLLNDHTLKGERNKIIVKNLRDGKSAQEIANIIKETLGKSITRQAAQKWINSHIKPMLRKRLALREEMRKDKERMRYDPMKRQKDSKKVRVQLREFDSEEEKKGEKPKPKSKQ